MDYVFNFDYVTKKNSSFLGLFKKVTGLDERNHNCLSLGCLIAH